MSVTFPPSVLNASLAHPVVSFGRAPASASSEGAGAASSSSSCCSASAGQKRIRENEYAFDCHALFESISVQVSCSKPQEIAETIAATEQEMLALISHYTLKELAGSFLDYMQTYPQTTQQQILCTLSVLYTLSLRASRYDAIALSLEQNILSYLQNTDKKQLQALIATAQTILTTPCKDTLADLEQRLGQITGISGKIEAVLSLFCYGETEYKERLQILIARSGCAFRTCQIRFSTLCQNLAVSGQEQKELASLNQALMAKRVALTLQAKPHYAALSKPLCAERETLINNHPNLFWKTADKILESAFRKTVAQRRENSKGALPNALAQGVNRAAKVTASWKHYTLFQFLKHGVQDLEEGYVSNVWTYYTEELVQLEDLFDLVRLFLKSLSDAQFQDLKANCSEQKIMQLFSSQLPVNFTLQALKAWCENTLKK